MLCMTAALVLLPLLCTASPFQTRKRDLPTYATPTYITPSSPDWPSPSAFAAIGAVPIRPWAAPCYPGTEFNQTACALVQNGYLNGTARGDAMGSAQSINWEECSSKNCWLNSLAPQVPQVGTCNQGRIPPYSVTVHAPQDAQNAIKFAILHKIKIVIKNTGHEYLGRSTGPDSLQVWTHKLKSLTYASDFQPSSCLSVLPATAITMGAGVIAQDAYLFATKNNVVITLGAYGSVGVGGGFPQGGGHGPLGPKYGLAVDNILQFKLITAAGNFVTANACLNPDLFKALRGGGGGSWGVVTEVTYRAHPATQVQVAQINVQPAVSGLLSTVVTPDAFLTDFLTQLGTYASDWQDHGWAGYLFITGSNASFNYAVPSSDAAGALADMKPFFDYLSNSPSYDVTYRNQRTLPSVQALVDQVMNPGAVNTPVGFGETLAGRLIPRTALATAASRANLAATIVKVQNLNAPRVSLQGIQALTKPIALQIYSTGPPPTLSGADTLVNTAWRGSIWEVVVANGWIDDYPQAVKNSYAEATNSAMDPLRALTPGGGCYYSEATSLEQDWQTAFFGTNYPELLAIKQKYDPNNIFNVWKGVGWTGPSDPVYRCYANN